MEISSLGFYENLLTDNAEDRKEWIEHLKCLIKASAILNVGTVTTFLGGNAKLSTEENLQMIKEIWTDIMECAAENHVRIAIENCPMPIGRERIIGCNNLMYSPEMFEHVFKLLPYKNLGLNFDPSHYVWQGMDYCQTIRRFRDRLFHVHLKDLRIDREKLDTFGILAHPDMYSKPKLPGMGDVDWSAFVSALHDIGYDGYTAIEIEDDAFGGGREQHIMAVWQSRTFLSQYIADRFSND